ncbi:protein toll-like [Ruditapes philippinarum]|uniref:protein toll-like n=1 Tax=Ruditapes philippinarum TaxID=129788 RepID=UPI00295A67C4|nr:protein toll-like [Ruditapes philippinarum]
MAMVILVTLLLFMRCSGANDLAIIEKTLYEAFECSYDNSSPTLKIENGVTDEQIKECLKTHKFTERLMLWNSHLSNIPKYLNILRYLVHLDLSNNDITEVAFEGIEDICQQLTYLSLDNNDIEALRKGDLDCLQSLQYLYLGNNKLKFVENGTFSVRMKSIRYIYLVNNSLTVLDFSLLSRLKLSDDVRLTVNASRNFITGITNSANITIQNFTSKTSVFIVATHNNITTVNIHYYFEMLNITNPFQLYRMGNSGFDVRFNPFICDCAMFPLADALRRFRYMDPDNPLFSVTCGTPSSLEGMMLRKVPKNQFNCSVEVNCPNKCICSKTAALDLVTIHCDGNYFKNNIPMTCPVAGKININIKSNKLTKVSSRAYLSNVSQFDVSQCAITTIETSFVDMIQNTSFDALLFNDNGLETIPKSFKNFNFSNGQVLALDGNPFNCDCHTRWMKSWLHSNKKHILRQNNIRCATGPGKNKPIIEVPDNLFICQTLTDTDELLIVIGSVIFVALIFIILFYKSKNIQVFMISHFDICKYCCRRRKLRKLSFDIFIPHSCEDDDVIKKIVDYLENHDPPYSVCIGEKNFKPGLTISENILDAIESSQTTLLVISNNFLRSTWCNMEFREAHMRFLRDRNINMVLIVLEELDTKLICKELKIYMDTHVYIQYTDNQFWAKLLQSLPIITDPPSFTDESPLFSN